MHCIAPVHNEYEMNADTKVHLVQSQASVQKAESFAGINIFLLYLFGKKKTMAVLSSDPAFFRNIVALGEE